VDGQVIERIHHLTLLTVGVNGGGPGAKAIRKYKVGKKDGPDNLVFQSVKDGKPMRDNNVLTRFINLAARQLGLGFVKPALPPNFPCNVDDRRRVQTPKTFKPDASLSHPDHLGHLRPVCA